MLVFWGVCFGNVCSELGKWFEKYADSTIQPPTIDIARKGVRPRRFFFTSFVAKGQPQPKQNSVWITRPENWFGCQKIPWTYLNSPCSKRDFRGFNFPYTHSIYVSTWARCKEKRTHYVAGNITRGLPILGGSNNANAKFEKFPLQSCIVWVRVGNVMTPVE